MTPENSGTELAETRKRVDAWIQALNRSLAMKEGVSLGHKCVATSHSLAYDIVSDSNETQIHIAFMNLINAAGKSKLLSMEDYEVRIAVHNSFWNEPLKTLITKTYKDSLRNSCKNPKIEFRYILAE
jgi:hypothetical protein